MSKQQTQNEQIRRHLKRGGAVTPLAALRRFGILRLGARIYDLRREGMSITRVMKTVRTRGGDTARVAEYRLA